MCMSRVSTGHGVRGSTNYADGVHRLHVPPGIRIPRGGVAAAAVLVCGCFLLGCSSSCCGWPNPLLLYRISFDWFISVYSKMIHCFINPLAVRRHRDGIFCLRNVYPSSEFTGMRPTNAPWRTLLPIHVYTCMRIYMAGKPELPNLGLHTVTQLLAVVVWINKSSTTRNYTRYEYVALVDSRPRRPLQVAGIVVS